MSTRYSKSSTPVRQMTSTIVPGTKAELYWYHIQEETWHKCVIQTEPKHCFHLLFVSDKGVNGEI